MKRRMKKVTALLLGAAMTAGMLAGCGGDSSNGGTDAAQSSSGGNSAQGNSASGTDAAGAAGTVDTSEHVDLKMYLIGDRSADFDEVYDQVNAILEEKLNCSLSVDFLSWGEHDTKYALLFQSGEAFDLIFTAAGWCHYEQTAGMGGFYALSEDFVMTYAPDAWDTVPDVAWNQARVKGSPYMVPYNNKDYVSNAMAIRGDLLEKFGMASVSNWEEFKQFNLACAADGIYGCQGNAWWQYFQGQEMQTLNGTPRGGEFFLYHTQDPSDTKVYSVLDWDKFTEYCRDMKEMADAGCWSSDILNSTDERQTGLLNGTTASMVWNTGACLTYGRQANAEHPEWKMTMVDPNVKVGKILNPYINGGMAININSQNKERAMMVINELYTNPKLQDLTMLGIEGKHWEAVGDDQYKILDATGYPTDNNCNWGWSNQNIKRTEYVENRTELDDIHDKILESFDANIKPEHPLDGFSFDTANVTTQCAAIEAVCGTYYGPLMNGIVPDVDAAIAEFKAAMESAGICDVEAELQTQIEAYLADK